MKSETKKKAFHTPLDLEQFQYDLNHKSIFLDSNIPQGYGLGSSGAVVAAVYKRYSKWKDIPLKDLKSDLARMEHFFHGTSSGIDPLVCFLKQKIEIQANGNIRVVSLPSFPPNTAILLIDTKLARKDTSPLINFFVEKSQQKAFQTKCLIPLEKTTDQAISQLLNGNFEEFWAENEEISALQYENFQPMIPKKFQAFWKESLSNPSQHLKLCGAGGGGYLLMITKDLRKAKPFLKSLEYISLL